jgi:hypothetical protein
LFASSSCFSRRSTWSAGSTVGGPDRTTARVGCGFALAITVAVGAGPALAPVGCRIVGGRVAVAAGAGRVLVGVGCRSLVTFRYAPPPVDWSMPLVGRFA